MAYGVGNEFDVSAAESEGKAAAQAAGADLLRQAVQTLESAGVENSRLEAQLLLALALGVTRTQVLAGLYAEPDARQRQEFARLVEARARRVPLAYLRGTQEFYGLTFAVTPAVLIPRPETELLVAFALEKLPLPPAPSPKGKGEIELSPLPILGEGSGVRTFADVGTGSGCIAIATLVHCPEACAAAFDISAEALTLARRNAASNGVAERIRFVRGDLLTGASDAAFDVIVSNPPYIPSAEITALQAEVRDYEPHVALDGGADGLDLQRRLFREARRALRPGGWLGVEVALGQAQAVAALLHDKGFTKVAARRDLAGIERIVYGMLEMKD